MRPNLNSGGRRASFTWCAAVAAAGVALAACSSSSSSSSSSTSTATTPSTTASAAATTPAATGTAGQYYNIPLTPAQGTAAIQALLPAYAPATGNTVRGVNGHTITIGGVATQTLGGVTANPGACQGAAARFAIANAQGGVNGYKINYVGCSDDGGSATTSQQDIENLVTHDNAFAVVPFSTFAASGAPTFLNAEHVPYFGWGSANYCGWSGYQYAFSDIGAVAGVCSLPGFGTFEDAVAVYAYEKLLHKSPSSINLAIVGATGENFFTTGLEGSAKASGANIVYAGNPIPTPPAPPLTDYTPLALQLIHAKTNLILDFGDQTGGLIALKQALSANGYTGDILSPAITDATLSTKTTAAGLNGVYATTLDVGLPNTDAEWAQIKQAAQSVGASADYTSQAFVSSYAAADFFLKALARVTGPLTTEKLANAINDGYSYPGIPTVWCATGQWPYVRLYPQGAGCVAFGQVSAASRSLVQIGGLSLYGVPTLIKT
jgi:branched-chain amino acid transport system substrate-binding protein